MKNTRAGIEFFIGWLAASFLGFLLSFIIVFFLTFVFATETSGGFPLIFASAVGVGVALAQRRVLRRQLPLSPVWILAAALKWGMLLALFSSPDWDYPTFFIGLAGVVAEAFILRPLVAKTWPWQMWVFLLAHYLLFSIGLIYFPGVATLVIALATGGLGYMLLLDQMSANRKPKEKIK